MLICRVAAARGADWWRAGFALFWAAPRIWLVSAVAFGALSLAVSWLPVVGPLAAAVLQPIWLAGLLKGCQALDRGGRLRLGHLFAGFFTHTRALSMLGLILGSASLGLMLLMFAPFAAMMGLGHFGSTLLEVPRWPDGLPDALDPAVGLAALTVLTFAGLLAVPLAMAAWFAPALVMLRHAGVVQALQASFLGCARNLWPLTIYGGLLMAAALIAMMPFGVGLLVLVPVVAGSIYAALTDIYRDAERG